jgi:hypothetical protein
MNDIKSEVRSKTAAELFSEALNKLTGLQAAAGYSIENGWLVESTGAGATYVGNGQYLDDDRQPLTNDPMVVTLYATLDAQILILTTSLAEIVADDAELAGSLLPADFLGTPAEPVLALAQSIVEALA